MSFSLFQDDVLYNDVTTQLAERLYILHNENNKSEENPIDSSTKLIKLKKTISKGVNY